MALPKRYYLRKGKYGCYFYDTSKGIPLTLEVLLNKLNRNELRLKKNFIVNKSLNKININLRKEITKMKNMNQTKCKANITGNCSFECEPCIYESIILVDINNKEMSFRELWNKSNPK